MEGTDGSARHATAWRSHPSAKNSAPPARCRRRIFCPPSAGGSTLVSPASVWITKGGAPLTPLGVSAKKVTRAVEEFLIVERCGSGSA
jgi:hypothetical protein